MILYHAWCYNPDFIHRIFFLTESCVRYTILRVFHELNSRDTFSEVLSVEVLFEQPPCNHSYHSSTLAVIIELIWIDGFHIAGVTRAIEPKVIIQIHYPSSFDHDWPPFQIFLATELTIIHRTSYRLQGDDNQKYQSSFEALIPSSGQMAKNRIFLEFFWWLGWKDGEKKLKPTTSEKRRHFLSFQSIAHHVFHTMKFHGTLISVSAMLLSFSCLPSFRCIFLRDYSVYLFAFASCGVWDGLIGNWFYQRLNQNSDECEWSEINLSK